MNTDELDKILVKLVRAIEVYTDDEVMSRADAEILLEAKQAISDYTTNKIIEARIDELKWGQMQFSGLDKSHVGRSYYNRNTAFKNYAVKFWNNRVKTIRDKFDDRIKALNHRKDKDELHNTN